MAAIPRFGTSLIKFFFFFFIIFCIFITLFQDKGHFSPFSGLPGSLLHVTAAACRCAHVSLQSPRWPLCCLQHTQERLIIFTSEALTYTDICNSNKIPVLTYPCLITSLVNYSRKRVHQPLSWTTNFVQTNPEMICSMCWNVQMCCVLWATALKNVFKKNKALRLITGSDHHKSVHWKSDAMIMSTDMVGIRLNLKKLYQVSLA